MAKETTDTKPADPTDEAEDEDEVEVDEGDSNESDDSDDNDDDSDDGESEEETVSVKDLNKVKEALDKERLQNKERGKEIRTLKRQLKDATTQTPKDEDAEKLVAAAEGRASKFRDIAVRKEASLALREAGAKVKPERLIKLLDLADVDIDDNGNVEGLADAIEELREDSPEFFKSDDEEEEETKTTVKRASVKKTGTVDGGRKTPAQPKPLSVAQQLAQQAGLRLAK